MDKKNQLCSKSQQVNGMVSANIQPWHSHENIGHNFYAVCIYYLPSTYLLTLDSWTYVNVKPQNIKRKLYSDKENEHSLEMLEKVVSAVLDRIAKLLSVVKGLYDAFF